MNAEHSRAAASETPHGANPARPDLNNATIREDLAERAAAAWSTCPLDGPASCSSGIMARASSTARRRPRT
ncbi:hypothetical protein [Pseudarthrobacter sp. GA104]|uniref:hypothetical protein n=1 Tax=Pseudarthrobacter sp. GA104 TaxID=2676311 RepID=UPI001E4C9265|nr:hypothetical protein [Pseudarthrobacter sp. GA104]